MSGELTNLIAILGVGIALATLMFTQFRIVDRRIDRVEQRIDRVEQRIDRLESTVQEVAKDVAELKGAVNIIRDGLRIRVGEPAE